MKKSYFTKGKSLITYFFVLSISIFLSACSKIDSSSDDRSKSTGNKDVDALLNIKVPDGFTYKTDQEVNFDITILAPDSTPVQHIPVNILDKPEDRGGKVLLTFLTDAAGKIKGTIKLPAYYSYVVVDPKYIGVMRNAVITITANTIFGVLGGKKGYSGNIVPNSPFSGRPSEIPVFQRPSSVHISYMGNYDNQGKPIYLVSPNDVIGSQLLSFINTSLPEGRPVPTYHPDYITSNAETNLNITALSDVWFTFISEGAGYKNSIAYYKYPTGNPPASVADIDTLYIILPNASLNGSGGSLQSGNKINLGKFGAGTTIGFALIANGWNGSGVSAANTTFYTVDNINPESQANLKRHSVLLYDNSRNLFLVGMEDIRRDGGSDNDFNDCVFSVKSEVAGAISTTNVNPIDQPLDSDGDGVTDIYDKFPNDPARAYINYYPAADNYATLAFEDNWPYTGDFDMNDLVVGYNYSLTNDALNRTVQMKANYALIAASSYFHNGFGVEFPFSQSYVQSVTGTRVTNNNVVTFASNGCESGQSRAVIIPFDDAFSVMNTISGFNAYQSNPYLTPDTTKMSIIFNTPITAAVMGTAPFNPFIIIDKTRGREVHLSGNTPTQKANTALFRTGNDNTNASQTKYYVSTTNLPYGLAVPVDFQYPVEHSAINAAYTNFMAWAQSGGNSYKNWYNDSGNMVRTNIYLKH